jgi:hypothetical protein
VTISLLIYWLIFSDDIDNLVGKWSYNLYNNLGYHKQVNANFNKDKTGIFIINEENPKENFSCQYDLQFSWNIIEKDSIKIDYTSVKCTCTNFSNKSIPSNKFKSQIENQYNNQTKKSHFFLTVNKNVCMIGNMRLSKMLN